MAGRSLAMARYGQRPENALKRANEFMEIGKPARALDTLQEVFRNKKWAYNWSESVLEPIMFRYLELCVELRKSHIAKESLFQYRNMFQSVNVGSLENVIRGYLRMAEKRTESAREQSTQAVVDIDDLDNLATPESILLSAVSGEDSQDRSDRTILTPWVKFLWESYCQCLELLRTNAHVENLYHDIARMAFGFCLKYARKTEFRKLCDKLRKHLEDICKLTVQTGNVSISKPETQQYNLETRLFQLEHAIQMELWLEAYKAIEDIHNLMNMSKKTPVSKTMANFYTKLALVFWKAGHYLFHAAAFLKLFQLSRELKKNVTQDELQKMACKVLVATLSIPLPSLHPEFDRFVEMDKTPAEKAQRLAILLGLQQPPTRVSLLKEIVHLNIIEIASPNLQSLYNWLEVEYDPLTLCSKAKVVIDALEEDEDLAQYVNAMRDVALVRLVRQVAQCYQSIKFSRLLELAVFADRFHLERLLVDCVRHNDMQIRIDHANSCIHFGVELSEASRENVAEGPFLQEMPSEQVRSQLMRAAVVLTKAAAAVAPHHQQAERERLRAAAVRHYHDTKHSEHQRVLRRHQIIEDRKEFIEKLNIVREEEEQRRQEEANRQMMKVEQAKLETEREEREKRRQQNEMQMIRDRHLKEKMQQISLTSHGQKVLKKLDEKDIKKIDAQVIAEKEAEELLKERKELTIRLKSQDKRIDYFERAKRIEEIPLLQKSLEEKQVQDQAFWEQQEQERIKQIIQARELDLATASRLKRMVVHKDDFVKRLMADRKSDHSTRLTEYQNRLSSERAKRLAMRAEKRTVERREEWYEEKERAAIHKAEEEERKREEEECRAKEEEEFKRTEEERLAREKREKEKQDHLEMLERVAARNKAREEEIERKKAEREKEQSAAWRSRQEESKRAAEGKPVEEKKDASWRTAADDKKEVPPPRKPDDKKEPWRPSRMRGDADKPREREERPLRDRDDRPVRDRDDRPFRDRDERPRLDRDGERDRERDNGEAGGGGGGSWRSARDFDPAEREKRDDREPESRFPDRDRFGGRGIGREDRRDDKFDDRREERPRNTGSSWRRGESPPERVERTDRALERPDRGMERPERGMERPDRGMERPDRGMDRSTAWRRDGPGARDREAPPRDKDAPRDRDGFRDRDGPRGRGDNFREIPRDGPPRPGFRDRDGPKDAVKDREIPKEKEAPRKPPPVEDKGNDGDTDDEWQRVKHR